jgi:hypothetical protein
MRYLNSSILVLLKAISDLLVCRILKRASECGKIEENIFTLKLKSKSLRRERSPHAEPIVSAFHSSGSPIIDTEDPQLLLCIHAQFQQSAVVLPCSRCNRRKSVPEVGIQCLSFCGLGRRSSKARESSNNKTGKLC